MILELQVAFHRGGRLRCSVILEIQIAFHGGDRLRCSVILELQVAFHRGDEVCRDVGVRQSVLVQCTLRLTSGNPTLLNNMILTNSIHFK